MDDLRVIFVGWALSSSELLNRGIINSDENLTPNYAAATVALGSDCRMFTNDDLVELKNNTTWAWEEVNGVSGVRFTSKNNGNSIFLPAAGTMNESYEAVSVGTLVDYWTSTAAGSCSIDLFLPIPGDDHYGYNNGNFVNLTSFRNHGDPIRAVRPSIQ